MKNISHQNFITCAAGEHLVLSNLLRLNLVAGQAPINTKQLDIICLNKNKTSSSLIQVKTSMHKLRGWLLTEKVETPVKNLFFCFIKMRKDSSENEIYVIDSKTVAYAAKMCHQIYLKLPGRNGQKHNDSNLRKLYKDYKITLGKRTLEEASEYLTKEEIEFLEKYSEGWLNQHRDAWHLLEDFNT